MRTAQRHRRGWLAGLWFLAFALICSSCGPRFQKISEAEVDAKKKARAQQLAHRLLNEWKEEKFSPLKNDEATAEMLVSFSVERQKAAAKKLRGQMGTLRSMSFVEAQRTVKTPHYELYRFKGTFEKPKETANSAKDPKRKAAGEGAGPWEEQVAEVRVVFNDSGRLSGFFVIPWRDAP